MATRHTAVLFQLSSRSACRANAHRGQGDLCSSTSFRRHTNDVRGAAVGTSCELRLKPPTRQTSTVGPKGASIVKSPWLQGRGQESGTLNDQSRRDAPRGWLRAPSVYGLMQPHDEDIAINARSPIDGMTGSACAAKLARAGLAMSSTKGRGRSSFADISHAQLATTAYQFRYDNVLQQAPTPAGTIRCESRALDGSGDGPEPCVVHRTPSPASLGVKMKSTRAMARLRRRREETR